MKRFIISIAAAALVMSACVKENAPVQNPADENLVPMEFSASSDDTKTSLVPGESGKAAVEWSTTDEISVWDGTANRKFTVKSCEGSTAVFTGMVSADATSFYAIYPYTETLEVSAPDNADRDIRLRFPVGSIQYAKPNSFSDNTAFAVAVASEGKFAFQNRTALLKFSLGSDMANVKSVVLRANGAQYLYGTVNVEFAGSTVSQGMASGYDRGSEVTLCNQDGTNLQTGVNYYIAVPGANFTEGFTVEVKFDDNTSVSKSSDKAIQFYTKNIYPLASGPLTKDMFETPGGDTPADPATSYYAAYTAGQDIMICGKAYNKSVYGEGTLVKAGETVDLTSGGKVYFVEPGAVSKIGPTYSATQYIVIGDDPTQRTTVTQAASIKVGQTSAHYAFLNLDIDMQITATGSGNDVMTVANNNSTIERIAFDNCRLEYPTNGRQFIYKADSGTSFKDMAFHSCDFVFTVTNSHAYLLKVDSSTAEHGRFDFYNNVFWHTSSFGSAKGFNIIAGATNATIDELGFKNNTFVNMKTQSNASAYFTIKKDGENVPTVDIQNNIFYSTVADCNEFLLRNSADAGTCKDNVAYMGETGKTCHPFGNGTPSGMTKFTQLTESPFASIDLENGKFVKADAYKSYGATR